MPDMVNADSAVSLARTRGRLYPWYDSLWLHDYSVARHILSTGRPELLARFEHEIGVFRTRDDFEVTRFDRVFDDATFAKVLQTVSELRPGDLEMHEARAFRRFVVHDHPYFTELQRQLVPQVSEVAGERLEVSYNFLSLYTAAGVCPIHMDSPEAKWTLDICLDQSEPWPIWLSDVQPWPSVNDIAPGSGDADSATAPASATELNASCGWQDELRQRTDLNFRPYTMQPGEALFFSGSSQWHYRDAMPSRTAQSKCTLLFMHFLPHGTREWVRSKHWAQRFAAPELAELFAPPLIAATP